MDVEYKKIKSIRKLECKEDVYCLTAKKNGNFIANGIVVHNCDATRYCLASHRISVFDQDDYNRKLEQQARSRMHPGGFGFR